jgi:flagellar motor protein MotB
MRLMIALTVSLFLVSGAMAQGTNQVQNPLRPPAAQAPAAQSPAAQAPAERPRRERSEAQKRNDADMRACGADWRANKASLQAQGQTWIAFSKDCRAKRRQQRGV